MIEEFHFEFNCKLFFVGKCGTLEPYWDNNFFNLQAIQVKQLMGMTQAQAEESCTKLHYRGRERFDNQPKPREYKESVERYEKDFAWREAWNALANHPKRKEKYPLQTQQEYIERRAEQANQRIAKLIPKLKIN